MSVRGAEHLTQSYEAVAGTVPLVRRAVAAFAQDAGATRDELERRLKADWRSPKLSGGAADAEAA